LELSKNCVCSLVFQIDVSNKTNISKFISFLDLKGISKFYQGFIDINLQKYFFVKIYEKTQGVFLKIKSNSFSLMDQIEEIFEF